MRISIAISAVALAATLHAAASAADTQPSKHVIWLLAGSAVNRLAAFHEGRVLLHGVLDHRDTWVLGRSRYAPPRATHVADGTNLAAVQRAAKSRADIVLLDLEKWKFTPPGQQRHPAAACREAARVVGSSKKLLLITPAFDLIRAIKPHYRGRIYPEFVKLHLAARMARYANLYEIQAQGCENNPRLYRWVVRRISRQVHRANPRATILAGLSTGPSGQHTTAAQLMRDYKNTRRYVSGYWVNIPGKGAYCPRCGRPRPDVAIAFFQHVYRGPGR